MKQSRRSFLVKSVIATGGALSGCVPITPRLFEPRKYEEDVSFWISDDQKKIVLIGKKTHYIFETTEDFIKTTAGIAANRCSFFNSQWDIHVDANNKVTLKYGLYYNDTKGVRQHREGELPGNCYKPADESIHSKLAGLEKSFSVTVTEELKTTDKVFATLISPVTLAVDGILYVGFVTLAFFTLMFLVAVGEKLPSG